MFKNPFSFKGCIRRTEYAITYIFFIIFYFTVAPLVETSSHGALLAYLILPVMWFLLAQGAKRCHDIGRNGWWQLIPMFWIVLLVAKSHDEINTYGQNPKNDGVNVETKEG